MILVSNDDGITAKGISELIKFLRPLGEIVVMAPDMARSGTACSLTVKEPIHYQLLRKEVGLTVYKCSGTPADCVKLAFHTVLDRKPSLVVGMEGCLKGVPSIGFSICSHDPNADFEPAGEFIRDLARKVLEKGLPALTCLNVNIPAVKELKGVRVCRQTKGQWVNEWENFAHKEDAHYYWLTGNFENAEPDNEETDHWALDNGYIAITPTTVDVTAYGLMDELKSWY